ncbi:hypothetical protein PJL18_04358 [Paenarthrobacter nicotinovorans]|nr:hypothetical protein [Paenarthrobacter nicotinovorans]
MRRPWNRSRTSLRCGGPRGRGLAAFPREAASADPWRLRGPFRGAPGVAGRCGHCGGGRRSRRLHRRGLSRGLPERREERPGCAGTAIHRTAADPLRLLHRCVQGFRWSCRGRVNTHGTHAVQRQGPAGSGGTAVRPDTRNGHPANLPPARRDLRPGTHPADRPGPERQGRHPRPTPAHQPRPQGRRRRHDRPPDHHGSCPGRGLRGR